jgi:hypothetical protein
MLAMRPQLVDVLFEAHGMLPDDAMFTAHVEPGLMQQAPRPLGGIELDAASWIRVLGETYGWTRDLTLGNASLAIGPLYLLGFGVSARLVGEPRAVMTA